MTRIHDISVPIRTGMPVWPSDGTVELEKFKAIDNGFTSNVTRMVMGTHTGTHVDAPRHFIPGATPVDELDLGVLIGPCMVLDATAADVLSGEVIDRLLPSAAVGEPSSSAQRGTAADETRQAGDDTRRHAAADAIPQVDERKRLLFKTRSSELWAREGFQDDYVSLDESGAQALLDRGVRLVGVDYLSIERFGGDGSVHRMLLASGVVGLEGLDLRAVRPGIYQLICLPLRIEGADGSPCRAVLSEL